MLKRKGFRFELMPGKAQARDLARFCGCARYVYNRTLSIEKTLSRDDKTHRFSYVACANRLPAWKDKHPWLKACPSQVLQQTLKDLDRGYQNFFAGLTDFPTHKKKFRHDAIRFPQGFEIDEMHARIRFPKLGWIRYRQSRFILGKAKNVTVTRTCGKWFASVQTEYELQAPCMKDSEVGIDMGVVNLVTTSEGKVYPCIDALQRHEKRLKFLQRSLARKRKHSKNFGKCTKHLAKASNRVANARKDALHKVSHDIAKNHGLVYMEDLNVKGMSKSARGTVENPGRNVKGKAGLNRAILNQGWGMFRTMLAYKLEEAGGLVVLVDPRNTSRRCPACGFVDKGNRPTQAKFKCIRCGFESNADLVGATNVLRAGRARLACEMSAR